MSALQNDRGANLAFALMEDPFAPHPLFPISFGDKEMDRSMLTLVYRALSTILPAEMKELLLHRASGEGERALAHEVGKHLPVLHASIPEEAPGCVSVSLLASSEYAEGAGRYLRDALSQWLIPGKFLESSGSLAMHFTFDTLPSHRYFLAREMLHVIDPIELEAIRLALPKLLDEMRINILSVVHARHIASLRSISLDQKNLIIQENLASLLNVQDRQHTLFDQMQGLLTKLSAEEKMHLVHKNLTLFSRSRTKMFHRETFAEMHNYISLFPNVFASQREARHISRLIAYQYLFKKAIQEKIQKFPTERQVSVKIVRAELAGGKEATGVLIGFNLLRETERLEMKQILTAIRRQLPDVGPIADSYIANRRDPHVQFFYLEVEKLSHAPLTPTEIALLRETLPTELTKEIATGSHPIFMPRNEEEILRTLVELSRQIRFVRDMPHITIHYEKQSDDELSFTILLVRLIRPDETTLSQKIHEAPLTIRLDIEDVRQVGMIKNKYIKEAAVLRATLKKGLFFRKDHSVDLLRARQKVVYELSLILGEFRDYNGGMILKQDEALASLRTALSPLSLDQEFLLENYFYSLRPAIMQTIHDSSVLVAHFQLLLDLLAHDLAGEPVRLQTKRHGPHLLCFLSALSSSLKDCLAPILATLRIPSMHLSLSSLQMHDMLIWGSILKADTPEQEAQFLQALSSGIEVWRKGFSCPVSHTLHE
jgi:hypothetical protein